MDAEIAHTKKPMSYNLFLDDERRPSQVTWVELPLVEWTIVRNYDAFVRVISSLGMPKRISFDHDLAAEHYRHSMYAGDKHYNNYYSDGTFKEKTGYECAKWLVRYCAERGEPVPEYYVHTMNPIGKENIISVLESYKRSLA
jgi:hypothetical protein